MRGTLLVLAFLGAPLLAQEYGEDHRLKVEIAGETRKVGFFVPKGLKKNQALPLVVAVPGDEGKAFNELGQWQQMGFEHGFAVVSVDIQTAKGWLPSEQLEMQRDAEAVTKAIDAAREKAKEIGVALDETAFVLTGYSGGTYLAVWLGLRRPDLFLGFCGRACLFHEEEAKFADTDPIPPNFDMPIFLYRGAADPHRSALETELAKKTLEKVGFRKVTYKVVEKMQHESKPDVFVEWLLELLKSTEKARSERRRIDGELAGLADQVKQGKAGALKKLLELVQREQKFGIPGGATALVRTLEADAAKAMAEAANLEADGQFLLAAARLREVEKAYGGLVAAKDAKAKRTAIEKSEGYAAEEMLARARELKEKGLDDKARELLEKIVDKYPETPAGGTAKQMLDT
jgi:predicted esterase